VEALIALSIMLVAAEIIRSGRGRADLSSGYPWIISYTFSLLQVRCARSAFPKRTFRWRFSPSISEWKPGNWHSSRQCF
jgi:hypothetical protein